MSPLFRRAWDAPALLAAHPPRLSHPNKRVVFEVACPPGARHGGVVTASRWSAAMLPDVLGADVAIEAAEGFYAYGDAPAGSIAWHQNFADPVLFGFYGGALFAQDEMQVAEHPALASVREAMAAEGHAWTVGDAGPTPVLVGGVERRVAVDTAPSLERGRLQGLYGNRFAAAGPEVVRSACERLDPPTVSNIVAIAAPHPGHGRYAAAEIRAILATAYAGYAAVKAESAVLAPGARVVMHTGFWGCGAFGGDRALMTALQALAARLAGLDAIVLHLGDASGRHALAEARAALASVRAGDAVADVLAGLDARGFRWGVSDGN